MSCDLGSNLQPLDHESDTLTKLPHKSIFFLSEAVSVIPIIIIFKDFVKQREFLGAIEEVTD